MRIYLIRHAKQESDLCNVNTPLSELGRYQAKLLGERLSSYHIDNLYSSDLIRAAETADIINREIECVKGRLLVHKIRKGLREIDFGELTGIPDPVIERDYGEFMESRYSGSADWRYPGGESGEEVMNRFLPVLEEIKGENADRTAVVTHGGTIRSLLAHLFQKGQADRLMFGRYFERASLTELYYDVNRDRFYLERFNDYAHLERESCISERNRLG